MQIVDLEFADALASPVFILKRLADPFSLGVAIPIQQVRWHPCTHTKCLPRNRVRLRSTTRHAGTLRDISAKAIID